MRTATAAAGRYNFANYVEGLQGSIMAGVTALFPNKAIPVEVTDTDESRGYIRYELDTRMLET